MFVNRCYDMGNTAKEQAVSPEMMNMPSGAGCTCEPVMDCPQERVCHRQMCYEVPHIIPVNTRIINHHVYRHTYQPMYTCTMEDEVCNVYDNHCGF